MQVVKRPQHLLVSHARLKIYPVQTAQPQLHFFIITSTTVVIFTTTTHSQHSLIVLSSTTGLKHTLKRTLFKRITENFQTISTYWDKNASSACMTCNRPVLKTPPLLSPHLFGPLHLVVQRLFGDLHLDDLLSEQLILVLGSAAFVLHALQLVVQTHRHIFGHLISERQLINR